MPTERSADVSVRPARPSDAGPIAAVQLRTWRAGYASIRPAAALDELDEADAAERWRDAVLAPPTPDHLVLVALEDGRPVGFAALGPGTDTDAGDDGGEVLELLVEGAAQRAGHGSRLLSAAIEHLESRGYRRAVTWRFADDEPARTFFGSAGWAEDGSRRTLDMGEPITQIRLHTEIGVSVAPMR